MEVFMAKRTKTRSEGFYRQLLAEQRRSGLSIRAFARKRGVPAGTLSSWAHEIKKRDAERGPVRTAASGFVPVSVVEAPLPAAGPRGGYELELGGGRVLRLPSDFDGERVAVLVRAVTSC
jgi:hypothetical protein